MLYPTQFQDMNEIYSFVFLWSEAEIEFRHLSSQVLYQTERYHRAKLAYHANNFKIS